MPWKMFQTQEGHIVTEFNCPFDKSPKGAVIMLSQ